jgi:mannitol-specific phosphotransferase system IIBC component
MGRQDGRAQRQELKGRIDGKDEDEEEAEDKKDKKKRKKPQKRQQSNYYCFVIRCDAGDGCDAESRLDGQTRDGKRERRKGDV